MNEIMDEWMDELMDEWMSLPLSSQFRFCKIFSVRKSVSLISL
jgi:hypothetical protein